MEHSLWDIFLLCGRVQDAEELHAHLDWVGELLSRLPARVLFYSSNALRAPDVAACMPAGKSGPLLDQRVRDINAVAAAAMKKWGIPVLDTHAITRPRPEKCLDGLHYMQLDHIVARFQSSGNSVGVTLAQAVVNLLFNPDT
mmetsp:Transcript_70139/g.165025  ORF Transcript_70139/g.165025 Transcript_70139/m.165025 type:complete len:142 (-) Transcript_70139:614-1039(-)